MNYGPLSALWRVPRDYRHHRRPRRHHQNPYTPRLPEPRPTNGPSPLRRILPDSLSPPDAGFVQKPIRVLWPFLLFTRPPGTPGWSCPPKMGLANPFRRGHARGGGSLPPSGDIGMCRFRQKGRLNFLFPKIRGGFW